LRTDSRPQQNGEFAADHVIDDVSPLAVGDRKSHGLVRSELIWINRRRKKIVWTKSSGEA
jgi:hypothetical protein